MRILSLCAFLTGVICPSSNFIYLTTTNAQACESYLSHGVNQNVDQNVTVLSSGSGFGPQPVCLNSSKPFHMFGCKGLREGAVAFLIDPTQFSVANFPDAFCVNSTNSLLLLGINVDIINSTSFHLVCQETTENEVFSTNIQVTIRSSKIFTYFPQGKSGVISAVYGQNVTIAVFTDLSSELEDLVYDEGIVCVEGSLPNVTCVYGGSGRKEVMWNCSVIANSSRKYTFYHRQSAYQVSLLLTNTFQLEPGISPSIIASVVLCSGIIILIVAAVTLTTCIVLCSVKKRKLRKNLSVQLQNRCDDDVRTFISQVKYSQQEDSEEHFDTTSYHVIMAKTGMCDEHSLFSAVQATEPETSATALVIGGCKWKKSSQGNTVEVEHCGSYLSHSVCECIEDYSSELSDSVSVEHDIVLSSTGYLQHQREFPEGGEFNDLSLKYPVQCTDDCLDSTIIEHLKRSGCFILGKFQTVTITEKGGEWKLNPLPIYSEETCAVLSAPPGVVARGEHVVIQYGIIPMGPFVFPSTLNLASVVVYLECKQKDLIQKPISLSLRHFILKREDSAVPNLCFVKASHWATADGFKFESSTNDSVFTEAEGTTYFTDFCLKGICVKNLEPFGQRICAIPMKIWQESIEYSYQFRIGLVSAVPSWRHVIQEFYCTDYKRELFLCAATEISFLQEDVPIESCVAVTDGKGWNISENISTVTWQESVNNIKFLKEMKCEDIMAELRSGHKLPHFRYTVTNARTPTEETHCNRNVILMLKGCTMKDISFTFVVKEENCEFKGERRHGDPKAFQEYNAPIGGFFPPNTFERPEMSKFVEDHRPPFRCSTPGNFRSLDFHEHLKKTPSDVGLLEVVEKIPSKDMVRVALCLGVPFKIVESIMSKQASPLSSELKIMVHWRDQVGPPTWSHLLEKIKEKLGPTFYEDLRTGVVSNNSWSSSSNQ